MEKKKGRKSEIRIAVVLDKQIQGFLDTLKAIPNSDNWTIAAIPNSDPKGILDFAPHLLIYRGSLDHPILSYIRKMEIPKILLLPYETTEYWDTISLEPNWYIDGDTKLNAKRLGEGIRALLK